MPAPKESLYDALGIPDGARLPAIKAAYDKAVAEFAKPTTAPDPRREALIRVALETLSDPKRRAEYDASLAASMAANRSEQAKSGAKRVAIIAAGVLVVAAIAIFFFTRKPSGPPPLPARSTQEILAELPRSIGRVQVIEMSGAANTVGLAFAIAGRTMVTTCAGLVANAQIVVLLEERPLTAHVSIADEELGICKLNVDSSSTWPILLATAEPKAGDRIFVPTVSAEGKVSLAESTVKGVVSEPKRRLIEFSLPGAASGTPILDTQGHVAGIVTTAHEQGAGRSLALPVALVNQAQSRAKSP